MSEANAKRKRNDNGDSLLKDEVEFSRLDSPFPRGGGSDLAPLDIKRAAAEATSDVFDQMVKAKKHKRSKGKSQPIAKPQTRIEPLTLSKIKIGTLILGEITSIKYSSSELVVSLPNNLTGYCPSEVLHDNQIGRFLRFAVTEVGEASKRRLVLSADPELVNQSIDASELTNGLAIQGTVKSVEEKGLYVDLGSDFGQGFLNLPSKEILNYKAGEYILAFLKDADRRIKPLTLNPDTSVAAVISQPALVPGTLVKSAPLISTTPLGCIYDLLGHIVATSDAIHSKDEGSAVRVIFSYPPTQINGDRQLGVSRSSGIVSLSNSTQELSAGKLVHGTVLKSMPNLGLFLRLGDSSSTVGFAHISQLSSGSGDKEVDLENDAKYKVGTEHEARVISFSQLDGVAYLSLDQEVIEQKYMSINDVKIGDVVPKATVDRILVKGGVLIRLSKNLVGIASPQQLTDVVMRNPETKYKPGQRVSARVLNVDLENERVELSLKKSIVDFKGPILESYKSLNGSETVGTVLRVLDIGAKILFFGGVKGLLPLTQMSETGVSPEDLVKPGQTVRVHVLEADASRDRLIVSSRPRSNLDEHIGEILDATVSSRNKHEIRVSLLSSEEAILVGSTNAQTGAKAKVGDKLRVKVLNDRLVTSDSALLEANLPTSAGELELGQQVTGYVSGSQPNVGVFVGFAGGFVGLVPANVLGKATWPSIGKVVKVVVDTVDFAKNRVFLSLPSASRTVNATITAVKATQLNLVTDDGQQGRIEITQLFESIDEIEDKKHPLKAFKTGQKLEGLHIIGRHDARNHRFLPLSHRTGSNLVLELALHQPTDKLAGTKQLAFVNNYSDDGYTLWVSLTPSTRGQMSLVDLSSDREVLSNPKEHFPVGSVLEVTILKRGPKISLTALTEPSDLALVVAVDALRLMVRLPHHKTSAISCVDSGDEFKKLKSAFKPGDIVKFRREGNRETLCTETAPPVDEGDVRKGYVWNVAEGGVFVALAHNVIGRVQIGQLSDTYLKNWKTFVKVGDLVEAKVLSKSPTTGKIELTLRRSAIIGKKQQDVSRIEIGSNYSGQVCGVESFGVFVEFKGVRGLCHKSEISDHPIDDVSRVFKIGDRVRVKVLRKDEDAGKLSLGMKAKYFEDDDEDEEMKDSADSDENSAVDDNEEDDEDDDDESLDIRGVEGSDDDDDEDSDGEINFANSSDSEEDSMLLQGSDDDSDDSDAEDQDGKGLSVGFDWNGELSGPKDEEGGSDSDDSESDDDEPRKRRRHKREEFVQDDTAKLQTRLPQSGKDFERLLVASPNSSILWMNYMAFELQLGEIDGAREIARRALKTISQREEEEKLNIWVALLNLEAQFGTKESTEATFKEAQQYMDSLTIHLRMATVYAQAGKIKEAGETYKRAHKRFGGETIEPWLAEMRFWFTTGNNRTAARSLGEQALQRLPSRLHRDFTKQFALLEFELGDVERGRTLFEALLASAAKRVDIWNVYIDQEIKQKNNEERINSLFDRVLQQRISMKQAKFFFKKWIDVASDQDYVKLRAREYVENREKPKDTNEGSEESGSDEEQSDSE